MVTVPWRQSLNFASALLLHSCLTVLLKEGSNAIIVLFRLSRSRRRPFAVNNNYRGIEASSVLDAYTSIFSNDRDGAQAELYFTNTGILLLACSLSGSIAMNLLLSDQALNMIVVGTFILCFVASMVVGTKTITLPLMALRRAGRFIWSDTPFVNFFTLIYIATALHGRSELRLQDYVVLRSIAILELVFMKAKLAATSFEDQKKLMLHLMRSEWTIRPMTRLDTFDVAEMPFVHRHKIRAFQTTQRLAVMLFKTSAGHENGCLLADSGPCRCPLPAVGKTITHRPSSLKICRPDTEVILLVDNFQAERPKELWRRFLVHAHGVLLRRLGKVRVVYLIQNPVKETSGSSDKFIFHSNVNLVTGLATKWLDEFPECEAIGECIVAAT